MLVPKSLSNSRKLVTCNQNRIVGFDYQSSGQASFTGDHSHAFLFRNNILSFSANSDLFFCPTSSTNQDWGHTRYTDDLTHNGSLDGMLPICIDILIHGSWSWPLTDLSNPSDTMDTPPQESWSSTSDWRLPNEVAATFKFKLSKSLTTVLTGVGIRRKQGRQAFTQARSTFGTTNR